MSRSSKEQIIKYIKKKGKLQAKDLSKAFAISPQAMHRHLRFLVESGVLLREGIPPKTVYSLAPADQRLPLNLRASAFIKEAREVLISHPAVRLVSLFGSVSRGTERKESDIDLMVWIDPREGFEKTDLWNYWDRHARHLSWSSKASLVIRKLKAEISIDTLLLDFPEEHRLVLDTKDYFEQIKQGVLAWRERNGSQKVFSFGDRHGWKYSSKAKTLSEIDFTLRLKNVS